MDGEDETNPVVFFGRRWDAPQTDGARQVPTPVGERCGICDEEVVEGDQGVIVGHVATVAGRLVSALRPVHRECQGATIFSHLAGVCECCTDGLTMRQRGQATMRWLASDAARAYFDPAAAGK